VAQELALRDLKATEVHRAHPHEGAPAQIPERLDVCAVRAAEDDCAEAYVPLPVGTEIAEGGDTRHTEVVLESRVLRRIGNDEVDPALLDVGAYAFDDEWDDHELTSRNGLCQILRGRRPHAARQLEAARRGDADADHLVSARDRRENQRDKDDGQPGDDERTRTVRHCGTATSKGARGGSAHGSLGKTVSPSLGFRWLATIRKNSHLAHVILPMRAMRTRQLLYADAHVIDPPLSIFTIVR